MEHLDSINRLAKALESFVAQLAGLITTKNWASLLLLIDAVLILFCFPGGILSKAFSTFKIKLLEHEYYPIFFWFTIAGIFVTALVIAVNKIHSKPFPLPNFTERKAIKGLRAFTKEDAEIFAQLERERDLRECLESITSETFRIGILMGESGVGKSSFLQAGIIPQLAQEASSHRGVYVRFSNQEPIITIYRALAEELQFLATENTETNNRDLLRIFSQAVDTADKQLILIFDQFEQFFVHFKQKANRDPFVSALKDWYRADNPLPIKILISVREDLSGRLIELQKTLGYSLSPYEVFRLEKFSPESATKVLQVIADAEAIPFDEKFMLELTKDELVSREDGLISPVDLQVLAKTIERQESELQAFNRSAFQKIGGIEGLMTRFLKTTLDAIVIPRHREAAIKVLLAITDLDRNVRAGALTIEEIQQKTQGTLTTGEVVEAVTWLASGEVRLVTTVQHDGNSSYELAHEKLIPALREEARRELTGADRANQLLDRRVNEWLGNQRSNRYLFNWQELRLFQQQKPYLVLGNNKIHKEHLLQSSWRKLRLQLVAIGMVLVLGLMGMLWWHTPWGQIQQVRWQLAGLSKRVSSEYRRRAALAFFKDNRLKQTQTITDSINDSDDRARVLSEIAKTIGTLENLPQAEKYLERAFSAAEQIDDFDSRARVLSATAKTVGTLENLPQAERYLERAFSAAEQIDDFDSRARVLSAIAETYDRLENLPQAEKYLERVFSAAEKIDSSDSKAGVLSAIAETYDRLENLTQAEAYLERIFSATEQIDSSDSRAWVLSAIAKTIGTLENSTQAEKYLERAFSAAEKIDSSYSRAWVLGAIAKTIGTLENSTQAEKYLERVFSATEQIDSSDSKAGVLGTIAETIGTLENSTQAEKYLERAFSAAEQIDSSDSRAWVLSAIAATVSTLENSTQAEAYLERAFSAAEQIDSSYSRAWVLGAIAKTIGTLENLPQAERYLERALTAAEQIDSSDDRARVLEAITQTQAKFYYWRQAHYTVYKCPTDECKVGALAHILTAWAEKNNYALVKKQEN